MGLDGPGGRRAVAVAVDGSTTRRSTTAVSMLRTTSVSVPARPGVTVRMRDASSRALATSASRMAASSFCWARRPAPANGWLGRTLRLAITASASVASRLSGRRVVAGSMA